MPRIPSYRLHAPSGRGVIQYRPLYGPNPFYLPGRHNSDESRAAYEIERARCIKHMNGGTPAEVLSKNKLCVVDIVTPYLIWAKSNYSKDEYHGIRSTCGVLLDVHGTTLVHRFGPLALKEVRAKMNEIGWCRTTINNRIFKLRRVFAWGVGEELVDHALLGPLEAVPSIRKGTPGYRESPPRDAVEWEQVAAVLPFVPPMVQTMLEVQHLSGMRSEELCQMRPCEVFKAEDVWIYKPERHKTAHLGKEKVICLGPRCRALLAAYEPAESGGFYFPPAIAIGQRKTARAAARKTKVYGRAKNRKSSSRKTSEFYATSTYNHAVKYGLIMLAKAKSGDTSRPPKKEGPLKDWLAERGVVSFAPHQLRHSRATLTEESHGLEAASALIGDSIQATKIYTKRLLNLARKVALETG